MTEPSGTTDIAILANLNALANALDQGHCIAIEARHAMQCNRPNLAIGCVLNLDDRLRLCRTLHDAILALHRAGDAAPRNDD